MLIQNEEEYDLLRMIAYNITYNISHTQEQLSTLLNLIESAIDAYDATKDTKDTHVLTFDEKRWNIGLHPENAPLVPAGCIQFGNKFRNKRYIYCNKTLTEEQLKEQLPALFETYTEKNNEQND